MITTLPLNTLGNLIELQKTALNLKIERPDLSDSRTSEYTKNVVLDMLCGATNLDHAPDLVDQTLENGGILHSEGSVQKKTHYIYLIRMQQKYIVGAAHFWIRCDKTVKLCSFATRLQKRGYGTQLLAAILLFMKKKGAESVYLTASDASKPLYKKFGFKTPHDPDNLSLQLNDPDFTAQINKMILNMARRKGNS